MSEQVIHTCLCGGCEDQDEQIKYQVIHFESHPPLLTDPGCKQNVTTILIQIWRTAVVINVVGLCDNIAVVDDQYRDGLP